MINIVLTPRIEMEPQYYEWLFHTIQFGDENYRWGHGIVDDLWTTGWQEMKKISIPFPPVTEQHQIADFLNITCSKIDALTADIQLQIDTLELYRRSVIIETVTKGLNPDAEMKDKWDSVDWCDAKKMGNY
ncbi:MAG: restriction endonuclease subunit S [Enterocloster bolteae]